MTNCSAFIFITERCNFRCAHCYVSAEPGRGNDMSISLFQRALDLLQRVGISDVRLTGGEPTVHPDFRELVRLGEARGFSLGLISNGSAMRQAWWTGSFLDSLSRCWISLYGVTAETHADTAQRLRGSVEFYRTLEDVGSHSSSHNGIGISALLAPGTSPEDVRSFLQLALSYGVKRVRLLPMQFDGRATRYVTDEVTYANEVRHLAGQMSGWSEVGRFISLSINDMHNLRDCSPTGLDSCLLHTRRMPSITPDGNIYVCCYNAYHEDALLGSIDDFERAAKSLLALQGPGRCRAFDPAGEGGRCVSCPLSRVDLKV